MSNLENINEMLTNELADSANSAELTPAISARVLANVLSRAKASPPNGTYTISAGNSSWEPFDLGIDRTVLLTDQDQDVETALYRLEPGAKFIAHKHTQQESCWVVEGDILVGDHLVQAGEMHVAEPGCEHPEIVARTQAVLLIRSQIYVGPLSP